MDKTLTLVEHFHELRRRIIICLSALILGSIFSFSFGPIGLKILKRPAAGLIEKLIFFSPQEALMIYLRIAFLCGLIISMPVILHQVWLFVSPAIEMRLRRHVAYFVFFSFLAFAGGCVFAYFLIIPSALKFLLGFAGQELMPLISAGKYISFATGVVLGTGLVFQMPVLSFLLTKLGVIDAAFLRGKYKYAVIGILIAAAIVTPTPDAFNMLILAGPMLFLYEISIWISFAARSRTRV